MILNYNNNYKDNTINIHDEFPKNKLVKIMKPYLLLYLNSCYSLIPIIKKNSDFDLKNKLRNFQKFNPQFGRRLVKMGLKPYPNFKTKSYIKGYVFNDTHIVFNSNDNDNFLSNHLKYDEINHHNDIGTNYFNVLYSNIFRPYGHYLQNNTNNLLIIYSSNNNNNEDDEDDEDDGDGEDGEDDGDDEDDDEESIS